VILQHWAKRMGNKNINVKTARGANMSTVGVDIGDWVFEKKIRGQSSYGPVVFRYCLTSISMYCSYVWCLSFRSSNQYFILISLFTSCMYICTCLKQPCNLKNNNFAGSHSVLNVIKSLLGSRLWSSVRGRGRDEVLSVRNWIYKIFQRTSRPQNADLKINQFNRPCFIHRRMYKCMGDVGLL